MRYSTRIVIFMISFASLACSTLTGLVKSDGQSNATNATPPPVNSTSAPGSPASTSAPADSNLLGVNNYKEFTAIYTWNVENAGRVNGVAISNVVGRVALLTQSADKYALELHDFDGKLLWSSPLEVKVVYPAIAFSPDGKTLVTGLDNGKVQEWNVQDGSLIRTLGKHLFSVRTIAFSPDGKFVASGGSDNQVKLWLADTGSEIPTCFYWDPTEKTKCHPDNKTDVRDLAFSRDGKYLAVSANVIVILDTSTGKEFDRYYDLAGTTRDLNEVTFSSDGKTLAASGEWLNPANGKYHERILLWDFPSGAQNPVKIPLNDVIEDLVFSADNNLLLGTLKDKGQLALYDRASREVVGQINLSTKLLLSYSADVKYFAVLSTKTSVSIWGIAK